MANSLIPAGADYKPKKFWERPEGTTGMIALGVGGLGLIFLLNSWLPAINNFLGMAIVAVGKVWVLGGLIGLLGLVLYVLFNAKFQTLCKFMFMSAMRKITSAFIELDPIGIMKGYRDTMKQRKANLDAQKANVAGQMRATQDAIDANDREIGDAMAALAVARNKQLESQLKVHSRNAERLTAFNGRLKSTLSKIQMIYAALGKYSEASDVIIQDMSNEIRMREKEQKLGLATSSAISSAKAILFGDGDAKDMYDEALEYLLDDFSSRMGEIDDFMATSQGIMEGIDLQNGVMQEKALQKLEAFEKGQSRVLGDQKALLIEQSNGVYMPVTGMNAPQAVAVPVASPSDYSKFFSNGKQ